MKKFLFCLALLPLSVNASVTYVWENLTTVTAAFDFGPDRQISFYGTMTFDDATVASGHLSTSGVPRDGQPVWWKYFGLEYISYAGHELAGMHKMPCSDVQVPNDEYHTAPDCNLLGDTVFGTMGPFSQNLLRLDLTFGQYLTGYINVGDREGNFQAHTSDNSKLWTVDRFTSDNNYWQCATMWCDGLNGVWVRVPEPMAWTLLLLALAIMYRLRAGANCPTTVPLRWKRC